MTKNKPENTTTQETAHNEPIECFVMMPISDQEGYERGHFTRVYEDIISPACEAEGFKAVRADEDKSTNMIQLEILKKILNAPMAICDLSSKNPNVLFELGFRQAFDKPVLLLKDEKTSPIFDVSGLRYIEYDSRRLYHEVLDSHKRISESLIDTFSNSVSKSSVNSLITLLSIDKAFLSKKDPEDINRLMYDVIQDQTNQLSEIRNELALIQQKIPRDRDTNLIASHIRSESPQRVRLTTEKAESLEDFINMIRQAGNQHGRE